jgi:hypothetical protein
MSALWGRLKLLELDVFRAQISRWSMSVAGPAAAQHPLKPKRLCRSGRRSNQNYDI